MAVISNTTTSADVTTALDVEFVANFERDANRLMELLGVFRPESLKAGAAMYQYAVTGSLSQATIAEGDEVPLSKYVVTKSLIGEMTVHPWRKLTTAQAILKGGFRNSVLRTDDKMSKDIRSKVLADFFAWVGNGTLRSTGTTLQAALAQADADLADTLEANSDGTDRIAHFVNRQDVAAWLGTAAITTQTAFGMTYMQDFLGVRDVFVTSRVPKGYMYVTPVENIHLYGCDFAELSQGGLSYTVGDSGLIGVAHNAAYDRTSCETNALLGLSMVAEVTSYICKSRIGKALASMDLAELTALAAAESVDITGLSTEQEILAAIVAAGVK